jgi:EpsI family protein
MVNIVQQGSFLVMLCGLIIMCCGNRYMWILALPVAYLVLMFPFLDGLFRQIQWPFQLLSAKMAVSILQQIGIPVFLEHNFIILPSITLEVARACSGIHYMLSIIAIVVPLMLLFLRDLWARIVLILFAVLIGISVNWLRVVFIALWVYQGGETLHGPGHIFQGLFISVFGFLVLFAAAWGLRKLSSKPSQMVASTLGKEYCYTGNELRKIKASRYLAFLMLATTAIYTWFYAVEPVSLHSSLSGLPDKIGRWQHVRMAHDQSYLFEKHHADDVLQRTYRNDEGDQISLFIGYFESQHQGKEIVHSDLQELYDVSEEIRVKGITTEEILVYRSFLKINDQKFVTLYWYDINGRLGGNNILAKVYSALDVILKKRSNGAFLAVYKPVRRNEGDNQHLRILEAFVSEAVPVIRTFLNEEGTINDTTEYRENCCDSDALAKKSGSFFSVGSHH